MEHKTRGIMKLVKETDTTAPAWKTNLADYACAIRPVAAIMFTSIENFSSVLAGDEELGQRLLAQSHKLQKYYFEQFRSTRIVEMGDGIMAIFHSAEQAVQCALKIQRGAKRIFNHNLHIGIHMGEVTYVENDAFGMSVNVAAAIQEQAAAGQILVTESIAHGINPETYSIDLDSNQESNKSITVYEVKPKTEMEASYLALVV